MINVGRKKRINHVLKRGVVLLANTAASKLRKKCRGRLNLPDDAIMVKVLKKNMKHIKDVMLINNNKLKNTI